MGLCLNLLLLDLLIVLLLCFAPGIPPHEEFHVIELPEPQELKGPLAPNNYLDYGERLHEGILPGPESIAVKNDHEVFVGLLNGDIARVWGRNFENVEVVSHDPQCDKPPTDGSVCGRPLGMRYISDDKILVADTILGIYILDAKKGTKEMLVKADVAIEGKLPLIINDLDVDKEGNIYWTISSTSSILTEAVLDTIVGPSGRLIKYNAKLGTSEVLMDKLYFPNGVQLSPDESFVLVAETLGRKVLRYWIKGAKKGLSDVFVSNLPGGPDNIRARPEGGYYVPLVLTIDQSSSDLMAILGRWPTARRFLARVLSGIKTAADWTERYFPNRCSRAIGSGIFHFETTARYLPNDGAIVVEVDAHGNIVGSMQGKLVLENVSEVHRVGKTFLFGTPFYKYLGKLDVKKLEEAKRNTKATPPPKREEL